jgi:hypothetical protein
MQIDRLTPPDPWIDQIFSGRAATTGGVIRRNVDWVEREIERDRFYLEVRRRGFHLMRAGNQYVILCAKDPIQLLF